MPPWPGRRAGARTAAPTFPTLRPSSRSDWSSHERAWRANQCDSPPRSGGGPRRGRHMTDVHPPLPAVREVVARALAEDLGTLGDLTGSLIPVDVNVAFP